jgi:hypothetical protein
VYSPAKAPIICGWVSSVNNIGKERNDYSHFFGWHSNLKKAEFFFRDVPSSWRVLADWVTDWPQGISTYSSREKGLVLNRKPILRDPNLYLSWILLLSLTQGVGKMISPENSPTENKTNNVTL